MKKSELQKLIREEVQTTIKEMDADKSYIANITHIKPFKGKVDQITKLLTALNQELEQTGPLSEEIQDAIDSLMELQAKLTLAH